MHKYTYHTFVEAMSHSVSAITFTRMPWRLRVDEGTRGGNQCPNSMSLALESAMATHTAQTTQSNMCKNIVLWFNGPVSNILVLSSLLS